LPRMLRTRCKAIHKKLSSPPSLPPYSGILNLLKSMPGLILVDRIFSKEKLVSTL
jgi:hypothetical protein